MIYFLWMRLPTPCPLPHSTTWLALTILWDNSSMLSGNLICREKIVILLVPSDEVVHLKCITLRTIFWLPSSTLFTAYLQRKSPLKFRYFFISMPYISVKNLSN
jgi:hypothetical protein